MVAFERQTYLARRRGLPRSVCRDAAASFARHARTIDALRNANTVGAYVAQHGEADPARIVAWLLARHVMVAVPALTTRQNSSAAPASAATPAPTTPEMTFRVFDATTQLVRGPLSIPQPPIDQPVIAPEQFDVALVPLVAFDDRGNRAGMGAGYYDRAFAPRLASRHTRPMLIGVAYAWQQVSSLDAQPWDVPLDALICERGVYEFAR